MAPRRLQGCSGCVTRAAAPCGAKMQRLVQRSQARRAVRRSDAKAVRSASWRKLDSYAVRTKAAPCGSGAVGGVPCVARLKRARQQRGRAQMLPRALSWGAAAAAGAAGKGEQGGACDHCCEKHERICPCGATVLKGDRVVRVQQRCSAGRVQCAQLHHLIRDMTALAIAE